MDIKINEEEVMDFGNDKEMTPDENTQENMLPAREQLIKSTISSILQEPLAKFSFRLFRSNPISLKGIITTTTGVTYYTEFSKQKFNKSTKIDVVYCGKFNFLLYKKFLQNMVTYTPIKKLIILPTMSYSNIENLKNKLSKVDVFKNHTSDIPDHLTQYGPNDNESEFPYDQKYDIEDNYISPTKIEQLKSNWHKQIEEQNE